MGENTSTETTTTIVAEETTTTTTPTLAPFLIRLHLIRHGETYANIQNIVLGQGDSPLTDDGVDIACIASASHINGKSTTLKYWRTYCSDLGRAHRTARIVLGLEDGNENTIREESEDINLIVDARLRELAKGAREGYSKEYSNEEAMALRRREATQSNNGVEVDVPKLESLANAMERVNDWIIDIIEEAANDYYATTAAATTDISSSSDECDETDDLKVYHVFALSHSALIRTIIHDKVNHQLPTDYALTKEGSLRIPNLSRTILDVRPHKSNHSRFVPSLVKLTDVSHLNTATNNNGPPYL